MTFDEHLPYALRQFETDIVYPLALLGVDISVTTSTLAKATTVLAIGLFFFAATRASALAPGRLQLSAEALYTFIRDTIIRVAGPEAKSSVPFLFSMFLLIWVGSAIGLTPVKDTFTSHLAVMLALSSAVFVYVNVLAFRRQGLGFLRMFVPKDSPMFVVPIFAVVEFISYMFRPLTLGFRVFANIVAGHIMLKLFADFCAMLVTALGAGGAAVALLPLGVMTVLFIFEFMIITIQSYIFILISGVYLRDALHGHS